MKNFNFAPFTRFAPLVLVTAVFFAACTPMDHTNPYDPASSLTAPNKVGFNISNNVTDIGSTTANITWNRNTEPEFAAYLVLRGTTDPGVPTEITAEMQTELMATNGRTIGALLGSAAVSSVFPTTAAGLKVVAYLPDANLTSFDDSGLTESTVYHYRILTLSKNYKTFAVSSNLRLETTMDKVGPTYKFFNVYSPYNLDTPRILFDVDVDTSTGFMWVSGVAKGLLMAYGISNFLGDEYFVAGVPSETSAYIDLENESQMLFLSGYPNTESPNRLRGILAKGGSVYVGAIRGKQGSYGSGGIWEITNAQNCRGLTNIGGSLLKGTTYADASSFYFGDWSSLLTVYGDYVLFFKDVASQMSYYDTYSYYINDPLNGWEYSLSEPTDTNQLVNGLAFDDNGRAYTSSLKDSTIRKYNITTGAREWIRGGAGNRPGQFSEVGDVAYYRNASGTRERIYVADPVNNRLTVYDEEGNLVTWIDTVRTFGREGSSPRGLKVSGNTLYMTVELGVIRFDL